MEAVQSARFRLMMQILEPHIQKGELLLLHVNYGYIVFTSKRLHQAYGNAGNAQWQDIKDLFYFTLSYDAEDKDTLKTLDKLKKKYVDGLSTYLDIIFKGACSEKN